MNIKTINLTGSEVAVNVGGYNSEIKNNGTDTIYALAASGVVAGADGVVSIPTGASVTVTDTRGTVYIIGTGSVEVVGKDFVAPVFKNAAAAGGVGENLLINPDFKVNQQGKTSYTGSTNLSVDRWRIYKDGMVTVTDGGVILSLKPDAATNGAVYQKSEELAGLTGSTVTLSVKVDGVVYSGEIVVPESGTSAERIQTPCGEWYLHHLSDSVIQLSCAVSENTAVVSWVKVEHGSKATAFVPPNLALELLKCQRYYQLRSSGDIAAVDMRPSMAVIKDIRQREDGIYEYIAE